MADIAKTIEIVFGARDNGLTRGLAKASTGIDSLENSASKVTQPLTNVADGILKVETAALALAAAYGTYAIVKSIEFQNAQIDLAKVLNDTDPAIESFTEGVTKLSETFGISAAEVLQGTANFKQAGFTAKEAAQLQKEALDLVIAGGVESAQATELLIASLKGFRAESTQATRFIEALNNVSNEFATDLGQLASGMARLSPVARTMGFSFEEATGLITPVIEIFRSGPEAANALRTGLLRLITDSKPVGDALKAIGVNQLDVNGQMRSGKDIFFDVGKAFKSLSENQKLVITEQLVGVEQANKMVEVFDNLEKVTKITAVAMEETGSVAKEVALRLDSAGVKAKILQQVFTNLSRSIGNELLVSFGGVAGGATELLQSFRDIVESGGLAPLFDALDEQGADFATFLQDIAKALPEAFDGLDFDKLIDSFDTLKKSIGGLFGDLDLTKPEDLQEALQSLIDFMALLTNASVGVIDGLKPLIQSIAGFLQDLADSDPETTQFITRMFGIAKAINFLLPVLGVLAGAISLVGAAIGAALIYKRISQLGGLITILAPLAPILIPIGAAFLYVAAALTGVIAGYNIFLNLDAAEHLKQQEFALEKTGAQLKKIAESTGIAFKSAKQFNSAAEKGKIVFDELSQTWRSSADIAGELEPKYQNLADSLTQTGLSADEAGQHFKELEESQAALGEAADANAEFIARLDENIKQYDESISLLDSSLNDGTDALTAYAVALEKPQAVLDTTARAVDKLTERERIAIQQTQELELALFKIASNEKIANIEFNASINIAEIEAEAKKAVAAFESINSVVGDISASTVNLFGLLGDESISAFDKLGIKDAISKNEKRLDKELELQEKLIGEQIKVSEERRKAIARGDAKIKIQADSLQPELEAVLFSLLDAIQLKANEEGLELLI